MVKAMSNKRNSLKVLSALFAFCNTFHSLNFSATNGIRNEKIINLVKNNNHKYGSHKNFEFKCKDFEVYVFPDGKKLVCDPSVKYDFYKKTIAVKMEKIRKKNSKLMNFFCYDSGDCSIVVTGINADGEREQSEIINPLHTRHLKRELDDILPKVNKTLNKNKISRIPSIYDFKTKSFDFFYQGTVGHCRYYIPSCQIGFRLPIEVFIGYNDILVYYSDEIFAKIDFNEGNIQFYKLQKKYPFHVFPISGALFFKFYFERTGSIFSGSLEQELLNELVEHFLDVTLDITDD